MIATRQFLPIFVGCWSSSSPSPPLIILLFFLRWFQVTTQQHIQCLNAVSRCQSVCFSLLLLDHQLDSRHEEGRRSSVSIEQQSSKTLTRWPAEQSASMMCLHWIVYIQIFDVYTVYVLNHHKIFWFCFSPLSRCCVCFSNPICCAVCRSCFWHSWLRYFNNRPQDCCFNNWVCLKKHKQRSRSPICPISHNASWTNTTQQRTHWNF